MSNPNSFLHRFNIKKLLFPLVFCFVVFLLVGGFSAIQAYTSGATSYEQYVNASTAPLFGGGLIMGAFGLMHCYKNRGSSYCLVGLFITLFCYGFIEYLFQFGVS